MSRPIFATKPVKEYLKHGIELCQGDTVFDVGSNIGLFSLWLYQKFEHNINIFAFEPVPPIFEVLKLNAERFDPEKLKVFPYGLSWEQRCISFGYYPNATPLSTAYPDGSKAERDKFKKLVLNNLTDAPPHIRRLRWFPPFLRSLILDYELIPNLYERALNRAEVMNSQPQRDWIRSSASPFNNSPSCCCNCSRLLKLVQRN